MLRKINSSEIEKTVADLCISANIYADEGICKALERARKTETNPHARNALKMIVKNVEIARDEHMPMCQDTGMVVVFVDIGQDVHIIGSLEDAINEGVRKGYRDGFFRSSIVKDPMARKNTGDNTPAVIHYKIMPGDGLKITVMPKGFGSENKSGLRMLTPSAGESGIEEAVIDAVRKAGCDPCPPIVVGVGVGGTMEKAAMLSKLALADMFEENTDDYWSEMEKRLLEKINELDIGAAGLKGSTTALGVRILTYPTHIAGLPVAVNIGCHVSRHKSAAL